MPLYGEDIETRVLPVRALLATLVVSLGLSYWLLPSESEMVERLMLDQQYERFAEMLRSLGDETDARQVHQLSRDQLATLVTLFRLTPGEQLHAIFSATRPVEYHRYIHAMVLGNIRYVDVISPEQAWKLIEPNAGRMSGPQFLEVSEMIAANAMSVSKPRLAAEIWERACLAPESTARTAAAMAQAWRWSAEPLRGAQALRQWMQRRIRDLERDVIASLCRQCATLALEGGHPALAVEACVDEMRMLPAEQPPSREQLDRALDYAGQSSRTQTMLPWIKRYVEAMPEAAMDIQALRQTAQQHPAQLAEYQSRLAQMAQLADWDSAFDSSFDLHLRLAAMGQTTSLNRCLALYDFLGRDEEMAGLLTLVMPVPDRPELVLELASLEAGLGADETALALFAQWLKSHPEDREAAYNYACLKEDMGDEEGAMRAFEQMLKHHPDDIRCIKKLAENYIRADRHREALALYAKLPEAEHDHYTLENYALLAESLDDHEQLFLAQVLTARKLGTLDAYMEIAETARNLADQDPAVVVLQQGVQIQPSNAPLRVALGELLVDLDAADMAAEVLMHDCVRNNYSGISALLAIAGDVEDKAGLLRFVGGNVEQRFSLSTQDRLALSVLCHQVGETERAEKLFATVPQQSQYLLPCAEARYEMGDYEEAAAFMVKHLGQSPRCTSDDWIFLGDIYDLLGRDDDARRAYTQSVNLIASTPAETAFREPSSDAKPNASKATNIP